MTEAIIPEEQSCAPEPLRQDCLQGRASFEVLCGWNSFPIPIVPSQVALVCNICLDSPIPTLIEEGHNVCEVGTEVFHARAQESNVKLIQRALAQRASTCPLPTRSRGLITKASTVEKQTRKSRTSLVF